MLPVLADKMPDGIRWQVLKYEPQCPEADASILFIPGFMEFKDYPARNTTRGATLSVRPSIPLHAVSYCCDGDDFAPQIPLEVMLRNAIDAFNAAPGKKIIVGHSLGASIAVGMMPYVEQADVAGIICLAPLLKYPEKKILNSDLLLAQKWDEIEASYGEATKIFQNMLIHPPSFSFSIVGAQQDVLAPLQEAQSFARQLSPKVSLHECSGSHAICGENPQRVVTEIIQRQLSTAKIHWHYDA